MKYRIILDEFSFIASLHSLAHPIEGGRTSRQLAIRVDALLKSAQKGQCVLLPTPHRSSQQTVEASHGTNPLSKGFEKYEGYSSISYNCYPPFQGKCYILNYEQE